MFDADNVLLDLWGPMRNAYDAMFDVKISDREFTKLIRDYDRDPLPFAEFGAALVASDVFENLPPMFGMKNLLEKLKGMDFDIVVISAAPGDDAVLGKRKRNLQKEFGDLISEVHHVGSRDKAGLVRQYAENRNVSIFCDDHPRTVSATVGIATHPIWFWNRPHSYCVSELDMSGVKIARSPADVLSIIAGE